MTQPTCNGCFRRSKDYNMGKYIVKRMAYMLVVLLLLSFLMFMIYQLMPNNRAYTDAKAWLQSQKNTIKPEDVDAAFDKKYKEFQIQYGTDTDNKLVRYARWMGFAPLSNGQYNGILQGNFGYSYELKGDVVDVVAEPMKNTIFINIFATIAALAITIPLGILCAVKRGGKLDSAVNVITIIGYSLPTFLVAILFVWIFCSNLGWLPPSGMSTPGNEFTGFRALADRLYYLILPLMAMTFCSLGGMTRYVRASMIESLSMDCIKTARAKVLREKVVIFSHAWRNALIPVVTLVVGWFLGIFSGSIVFEETFGLNGMGALMIKGVRTADFDLVMFVALFYVILSLAGNLIIDIVYGLVDPRVRVNK